MAGGISEYTIRPVTIEYSYWSTRIEARGWVQRLLMPARFSKRGKKTLSSTVSVFRGSPAKDDPRPKIILQRAGMVRAVRRHTCRCQGRSVHISSGDAHVGFEGCQNEARNTGYYVDLALCEPLTLRVGDARESPRSVWLIAGDLRKFSKLLPARLWARGR